MPPEITDVDRTANDALEYVPLPHESLTLARRKKPE
jgi:hypothetical protein